MYAQTIKTRGSTLPCDGHGPIITRPCHTVDQEIITSPQRGLLPNREDAFCTLDHKQGIELVDLHQEGTNVTPPLSATQFKVTKGKFKDCGVGVHCPTRVEGCESCELALLSILSDRRFAELWWRRRRSRRHRLSSARVWNTYCRTY